jgi:hypothetical protein
VLDSSNCQSIPIATITLGSVVLTTDSQGKALLCNAVNGAVLSVSKAGYQSKSVLCQVPNVGPCSQTVILQAAIVVNTPRINTVAVRPLNVTIQALGINIPLRFDVATDWNQAGDGSVHYNTGRKEGDKNRSDPITSVTLNPTLDLPCDFLPIPKQYAVTFSARGSNGQSAPVSKYVWAIAMPAWLINSDVYFSGEDTSDTSEKFAFEFEREFLPDAARSIDWGIFTMNNSIKAAAAGYLKFKTLPNFVGSAGFEGGLKGGLEVQCNNVIPGGMKPYGKAEIDGKFVLDGQWYPTLDLASTVEASIYGAIGIEVPLRAILLLDPSGTGLMFNNWLDGYGSFVTKKFDKLAYIKGDIGPKIKINFPVKADANGLHMDPPTSFGLGGSINLIGHLGADILYLECLLGGAYSSYFNVTPDGMPFDHAEMVVKGSISAGSYIHEMSWPYSVTKRIPEQEGLGVSSSAAFILSSDHVWNEARLVSRDYIISGYARFIPSLRSGLKKSRSVGPLGVVHSDVFVENVFPNTTASLCGSNTNDVWVVFSCDNTNLVQVQAMDIQYTHFDGANWSIPMPVATNTQSEFYPVIALDASNRLVAAWNRVRDPNYLATNEMAGFLSQMDVVAAWYDREQMAWMVPQVISSNACLNFGQTLVKAPDGALALWWQSNSSNQLMSGSTDSNSSPSVWWWSRWDVAASQFGPAESFATNMISALTPSFLYGRTNASLFWVQDLHEESSTNEDTALQYCSWDGSNWSSAQVISASGAVVSAVQSVMLPDGSPFAVWWQNGDMVYARGPTLTNWSVARTNSGSLCMQKFSLVSSPENGCVVLVFPSSISNAVTLTYRVYDVQADSWGGDFVFDGSDSLDFNLSPAFVGKQMQAVYARGLLGYSNTVVGVNGSNVTLRVPYRAQTDLMLSHFEFDADLTVSKVELPAGYPPSIRAEIANTGDLILSNVVVEIRRDGIAGPVVMVLTNSDIMLPHTQKELVAAWPISDETDGYCLAAIIDPDNQISEYMESNNTATNWVLRTQLAIDSVRQEARDGSNRVWYVQVRNPIARAIRDVAVSLIKTTTNGPVLAGVTISNISAFTVCEVEIPFVSTGLSESNVLVTVVESAKVLGDSVSARVISTSTYRSDDGELPEAAQDLRFLRPGLSNEQVVAWTTPTNNCDGVYVTRATGTNAEEVAGFAVNPESVFSDVGAGCETQITYRVRAYNSFGIGPASLPIVASNLDINRDGIPDDWQATYFGAVDNPAAGLNEDSDNDGVPNWREYVFGTCPTNGADFPNVDISLDDQNNVNLGWRGAALQAYGVESSTNLATWSLSGNRIIGVDGSNVWVDTSRSQATKFYRVVAP